jgi:ketosteroid isomerase-like protein
MVQGKPEITKFLGDLFAAISFRDAVGMIAAISVSGDLAIETGHYAWTLVPPGGAPMPDKGKYVHVWPRTTNGTRKVIRYFSNSGIAAPAP